ncbi:MAG: OmpA family protein [Rhodospirillaceae bacterium]|nr:OmpA family protein [Rhodospirillaceae bacterium]
MRTKPAGAPTWMVTFADLMALLLTMFVMLLSFAEMDVQKFKQIAGNMRESFGLQYIQRLAGVVEIAGSPMGEYATQQVPKAVIELTPEDVLGEGPAKDEQQVEEPAIEESVADSFKKAIAEEISNALANVEEVENGVVIRFPAKIAFPSGGERLTPEFIGALTKMVDVLENTDGDITVAGHTDDRPISTERFRSNWDLSAARANSVIHFLLENTNIDAGRLGAIGYADSRPLALNDTEDNRAGNRRVEIIITKPPPSQPEP